MNFVSIAFLSALAAAAGPTLIHLLNKRRHRVVEWAAMDFLREAIHRNKKLVEIRDLLLLILRTLAIVFFVLAMAQPYFSSENKGAYSNEPVHAVLIVDNSLSMGYTQLDKTLLDVAKEKCKTFVQSLPRGSNVSVIPLCGSERFHAQDIYATKEDAVDAIEALRVVDRSARAGEGAEHAKAALAASIVPTKRVVFVSDMQENAWGADNLKQLLEPLGDVQLVQVSPERRSNTWVADFHLRDGIADADAAAVFEATLRHEGDEPRSRVRVSLKINEVVAEERFVDLLPGQTLQLLFKHRFDVAGTSEQPLFLHARLAISPDHLPHDDHRDVIVPVVAQVPIVFIDQYGEEEAPRENLYGETFVVRRLLAPRTRARDNDDDPDRAALNEGPRKHLVDIRHRKPNAVSKEDLSDARLVVLAGVRRPTQPLVQLLREYVEQGGQLLLAGGGRFDPASWNSDAWMEGKGVLPGPVKQELIGQLPPPDASDWPSFNLAVTSFKDPAFALQLNEQERQDLLSVPFFFQAFGLDIAAGEQAIDALQKRLTEQRDWLIQHEQNEERWAKLERAGRLQDEEAKKRQAARLELEQRNPNWLSWHNPLARDIDLTELDDQAIERLAKQSVPVVMGRYDNGEPFAVRQELGKGRVVTVTTGLFPLWNNIAAEHSVLIFDSIVRAMMTDSLPNRTLTPVNEVIIPIASRDQAASFLLTPPSPPDGTTQAAAEPEPIGVEALGKDSYGVIIRSLGQRGVYKLERQSDAAAQQSAQPSNGQAGDGAGKQDGSTKSSDGAGADTPSASNPPRGANTQQGDSWTMLVAVNGPMGESELSALTEQAMFDKMQLDRVRWVTGDDPISLEGESAFGVGIWKWLLTIAIACLLGEMLFLARPATKEKDGSQSEGVHQPHVAHGTTRPAVSTGREARETRDAKEHAA